MKALTVYQPWASLIALGEKKIETRGWATRYRGPLAIHAANKVDKQVMGYRWIGDIFREHGLGIVDIPMGTIIAICNLAKIAKVVGGNQYYVYLDDVLSQERYSLARDTEEYALGDYSLCRYAWHLTEVRMLETPIPAKGMQRLWNFDSKSL